MLLKNHKNYKFLALAALFTAMTMPQLQGMQYVRNYFLSKNASQSSNLPEHMGLKPGLKNQIIALNDNFALTLGALKAKSDIKEVESLAKKTISSLDSLNSSVKKLGWYTDTFNNGCELIKKNLMPRPKIFHNSLNNGKSYKEMYENRTYEEDIILAQTMKNWLLTACDQTDNKIKSAERIRLKMMQLEQEEQDKIKNMQRVSREEREILEKNMRQDFSQQVESIKLKMKELDQERKDKIKHMQELSREEREILQKKIEQDIEKQKKEQNLSYSGAGKRALSSLWNRCVSYVGWSELANPQATYDSFINEEVGSKEKEIQRLKDQEVEFMQQYTQRINASYDQKLFDLQKKYDEIGTKEFIQSKEKEIQQLKNQEVDHVKEYTKRLNKKYDRELDSLSKEYDSVFVNGKTLKPLPGLFLTKDGTTTPFFRVTHELFNAPKRETTSFTERIIDAYNPLKKVSSTLVNTTINTFKKDEKGKTFGENFVNAVNGLKTGLWVKDTLGSTATNGLITIFSTLIRSETLRDLVIATASNKEETEKTLNTICEFQDSCNEYGLKLADLTRLTQIIGEEGLRALIDILATATKNQPNKVIELVNKQADSLVGLVQEFAKTAVDDSELLTHIAQVNRAYQPEPKLPEKKPELTWQERIYNFATHRTTLTVLATAGILYGGYKLGVHTKIYAGFNTLRTSPTVKYYTQTTYDWLTSPLAAAAKLFFKV